MITQEQKRALIAEACGWKNIHPINTWREGGPAKDGALVGDFNGRTRSYIPNYFGSLDAIHAATMLQTQAIRKAMRYFLYESCGQMEAHNAPSEDRAEALGKALKLWE